MLPSISSSGTTICFALASSSAESSDLRIREAIRGSVITGDIQVFSGSGSGVAVEVASVFGGAGGLKTDFSQSLSSCSKASDISDLSCFTTSLPSSGDFDEETGDWSSARNADSPEVENGRLLVDRIIAATSRPMESASRRRVKKRWVRVGVLRNPRM